MGDWVDEGIFVFVPVLVLTSYVRVVLVRRFFSASPVPSAVPGSLVVKFFIASPVAVPSGSASQVYK